MFRRPLVPVLLALALAGCVSLTEPAAQGNLVRPTPSPTPAIGPTPSPVPSSLYIPVEDPFGPAAAERLAMAQAVRSRAAAGEGNRAQLIARPSPPTRSTAGGYALDLYRQGVFLPQPDNRTCVPTVVRMIMNVLGYAGPGVLALYNEGLDHQVAYPYPGLDPGAEAYLLNAHAGGGWWINNATSFDASLRQAVRSIATTHRPVGLFVMNGNHVWMLNGFTATADPARTDKFSVTGVYVTGPYYFGHPMPGNWDMAPDTYLSAATFRGFVGAYNDHGLRNAWYGHYVTINPS